MPDCPELEDEATELTVTFQPALYLQRRAWVFDVMRRERVTNVLDVGCGEGETIACLCNPAPWLSPLSMDVADFSCAIPLSNDVASVLQQDDHLHLQSVYACDISSQILKEAVKLTAPASSDSIGLWQGYSRWEPLEVKIWEGGLERYNPDFVNMDCVICTEVIEHLPEDILADFAPMLLGLYHPRILLITTPSYTFNERFTAPDAPPTARRGFPDPTGRTNRIFRHDDHKFEWTVEEFAGWCKKTAEQWGYDVEISGVGRAREQDDWGRDDRLGYASQVAAFRRKETEAWASMRKRKAEGSGIWERIKARQSQTLITTHQYKAHDSAGKAHTLAEIGELVKARMASWDASHATVHELWFERDVSDMCGGWLSVLVAAMGDSDELSLQTSGAKPLDWVVRWSGFVAKQRVEEQPQDEPRADDTGPSAWNESVAWRGYWSQESINGGWGAEQSNSSDTEDADWGWGQSSQSAQSVVKSMQ